MATVRGRKLKYLVRDVDRYGKVRWYVRRPGEAKVLLTETPGTPEFEAAYHAALASRPKPKASDAGSLGWLARLYLGSSDYLALDPSTRRWRRRALENIAPDLLALPFRAMDALAVQDLRDQLRDTPSMANERVKALKALFVWAIANQKAGRDPTAGVKPIRYVSKGHQSWSIEEVEAFEARWPIGTKQRLAMALLLYTACRREDVVRLGPKHVSKGRLRFIQAKNEHRAPVEIDIPIHPDLAEIIAATKKTGLKTFLVTDYGQPFAVHGFGIRFRRWCDQAGLAERSAHGLRKACAVRLAERGVSAHGITAITGHKTLEEVERYTAAARKRLLADDAMAKF